jgi:hypothetical protein
MTTQDRDRVLLKMLKTRPAPKKPKVRKAIVEKSRIASGKKKPS